MYNPGSKIRLHSSGRTDTGRVRDNNEDNIRLWQKDGQHVLAIVADGMGGAVAGEEASRIAVDTIQSGLAALDSAPSQVVWNPSDIVDHLTDTIRLANANIIEESKQQPELKGMGTTVTLAYVQEQSVVIGHVGDSRAYHVRGADGYIEQITADHSFVQALVDGGHLTPEEAENHPMGNVLYRALGQAYDLEIDIYHAHMQNLDRLVLCSDGLTLHVRAHEIAEVVMQHDEPEAISQALVALANERGGRDNISVVIILATVTPTSEETTMHDTQSNPLRGDEDSGSFVIPRENSNMGASEPPITRDTQTQEVVRVSPAEKTSEAKQAVREKDSTPPDVPGEGRDNLLPEQ